MPPRTEIGTTIKLEEFEKYPNGLISIGVISNSAEDGIDLTDKTESSLLFYSVQKESNQDWHINISEWNNSFTLIDNYHIQVPIATVTKFTEVKRIFNCSQKVFNLLT